MTKNLVIILIHTKKKINICIGIKLLSKNNN